MQPGQTAMFDQRPPGIVKIEPCRSDMVMKFDNEVLSGCEWNLAPLFTVDSPTHVLTHHGTMPVTVSVMDSPDQVTLSARDVPELASVSFAFNHIPYHDISQLSNNLFTLQPSNETSSICNVPQPPMVYTAAIPSSGTRIFNSTHIVRTYNVPRVACVWESTEPLYAYHKIKVVGSSEVPAGDGGTVNPNSQNPGTAADAPIIVWVVVAISILAFLVALWIVARGMMQSATR
jgi:hypothetical protein